MGQDQVFSILNRLSGGKCSQEFPRILYDIFFPVPDPEGKGIAAFIPVQQPLDPGLCILLEQELFIAQAVTQPAVITDKPPVFLLKQKRVNGFLVFPDRLFIFLFASQQAGLADDSREIPFLSIFHILRLQLSIHFRSLEDDLVRFRKPDQIFHREG